MAKVLAQLGERSLGGRAPLFALIALVVALMGGTATAQAHVVEASLAAAPHYAGHGNEQLEAGDPAATAQRAVLSRPSVDAIKPVVAHGEGHCHCVSPSCVSVLQPLPANAAPRDFVTVSWARLEAQAHARPRAGPQPRPPRS